MKEEQFMEHLIGLAKTKLERFNSLSEETGCYWTEIVDGRLDWEVYRHEVLALRSLSKDQILESFEQWLLPSHGKSRELVVQVIGDGSTPCGVGRPEVEIDDISHFITNQVQSLRKVVGKSMWEKVY
jgi:secreted Zn-dependent insulinase-like peptidase